MGRYLEFLEPATGRIIGHRVYEGPYRRKPSGEWIHMPREKWTDSSPILREGGAVAEKSVEVQTGSDVLWKRLAVASIERFLKQPSQTDVAARVRKRLASPLEHIEVVDANETARALEHLRGFAMLQNTTITELDPQRVVVVYLNGPPGGSWRIGVVFDRVDAATKGVVFIPGK